MSQSLTKLSTHIVFSTKYRQPLIDAVIEDELHAYLGGVCKIMDCIPVKVGGYRPYSHIMYPFEKSSFDGFTGRSKEAFFQMDQRKR